jgi:hypothetical protein
VTTIYETAGRAKKVTALVTTLDVRLIALGVHPYSAEAAEVVSRFSDMLWRGLALAAGVRAPSDKTRAAVVAAYAERPVHVARAAEGAGVEMGKVACPRCEGAGGWCAFCGQPDCDGSKLLAHPDGFRWTTCTLCGGEAEVSATIARVHERRRAQVHLVGVES